MYTAPSGLCLTDERNVVILRRSTAHASREASLESIHSHLIMSDVHIVYFKELIYENGSNGCDAQPEAL